MKTIYLLRHFKVKDPITIKLNSDEFNNWVEMYDQYDLEYRDIQLPKNIDKIYSSTQNRAVKTAESLEKEFELTDKLIEVEASSFMNTQLKFSKTFWLLIGRALWYFNLTKNEKRKDTQKRTQEFLQKLLKEDNETVLLVSHGLFLKVLIKELKKYGYSGEIDLRPKSGKLYQMNLSKV